jgi:CheY-like chemotaxis protein
MEGEITVHSKQGEGTTFSFKIKSKGNLNYTKPLENYSAPELEGRRVLIVDDNVTTLSVLKNQLDKWKLLTALAISAREALEMLSSGETFDLIITDLQMPEINGIELAKAIKEKYPDVPLFLLAGSRNESKSEYLHLFKAVVIKPVKYNRLLKLIQSQLKQNDREAGKIPAETKILSEEFSKEYPLSILLTEDNLINQKLAVRILNKLGYIPDIANNGREAVEMQQEKAYDLILMDVLMPEMDGLEATRIIRQKNSVQPVIIAMTANAFPEDRERCLQAGMNDYLSKPIVMEELLNALKKSALNSFS